MPIIAQHTHAKPLRAACDGLPDPPERTIRLFGTVSNGTGPDKVRRSSLRLIDAGWEERTAESDAEGSYAIEDLRAGSWDLVVEAEGFRTLRRRLELTPQESERRLDLPLVPADVVKIRVYVSSMAQLPGAYRPLDEAFKGRAAISVVENGGNPDWIPGCTLAVDAVAHVPAR